MALLIQTPDEILKETLKEHNLDASFVFSHDAIIEAMKKYADQFLQIKKDMLKELAEEMWDAHCEYIGENLFSLETVAGCSVMKREDFINAINELLK